MTFSQKDKEYMRLALSEAKKSLNGGEYPVGAVLVIDGEIVGKIGNSTNSKNNWTAHSESELINNYSSKIKDKILPTINDPSLKKISVELYTTLEPCLMCLGISVLNRVSRIVYACKDPHGGATKLSRHNLPGWDRLKWPLIQGGLYGRESYLLLTKFMKNQKESYWKETLELFKKKGRRLW